MSEEKEKINKKIVLNNEIKQFSKAFKENFITLIISSLGLLVALTWNNLWTSWVSTLPVENTLTYKFLIAMIITVIAVILTYMLSKVKEI